MHPYSPFYFRGPPQDPEKASLLANVLQTVGINIEQTPRSLSKTALRRYSPDMTDEQVLKLYGPQLIKEIGSKFVQLVPVLPCPFDFRRDIRASIRFFRKHFPNIERQPALTKTVIFLESNYEETKLIRMVDRQEFPRSRMVMLNEGALFAIPLYDRDAALLSQGYFANFWRKSNSDLEALFQRASDSEFPPYFSNKPPNKQG